MSDYKPANIQALAEAMYKRECDYVGPNHGEHCIAENVKTLQSFEDRIAKLEAKNAANADHARLANLNRDSSAKALESANERIAKLEAVADAAKKCAKGCRRCNSLDGRYYKLQDALAALKEAK